MSEELINFQDVRLKIELDKPLTKQELATYLGVGYSTVKGWPWLPMIGEKLFYSDFLIARRQYLGLEGQHIGAHQSASIVGIYAKSRGRRGSPSPCTPAQEPRLAWPA